MSKPLISVVVTTRNNESTLNACLDSIRQQTYKPIELIVIDNNSTDRTKVIAKKYTEHVYNKGPERSAQRNYGVSIAKGTHVLIIDSDMRLTEHVVSECTARVRSSDNKAVIVPEESFGEGFWAKCKKLERSFYVGQDAIEAARFFPRDLYQTIGGYNEAMTGGEDWDLTHRLRQHGTIGRVGAYIFHDEGRPHFARTVKKMYYYGSHASAYFASNTKESAFASPAGPFHRYRLFFSDPRKLFKNPVIGMGMLTLKTAEYAAGAIGLLQSRLKSPRQSTSTQKEN